MGIATASTSDLYSEYDINKTYDDPNSYSRGKSYYGKGKYPSDWSRRQDAVWERQNYRCGRCQRYKGDTTGPSEVHHLHHLSDGGSNELSNLVGLCADCHALMHPDIPDTSGRYENAPMYPSDDGDSRVAVIRKAGITYREAVDIGLLEELSSPSTNKYAVNEATANTSSRYARNAEDRLYYYLKGNGYVPRSNPFHELEVDVKLSGVKGLVRRWSPEVSVESNAELIEEDPDKDPGSDELESDRDEDLVSGDYLFTPDASYADVTITEGDGQTTTESVRFSGRSSQREVSETVAPPPLRRDAPSYVIDTIIYLATRGLVPGAILTYAAPQYLPTSQWWTTLPAYILLTGLLWLMLRATFRLWPSS
ncbi:HNH endonuclease [Halorhabdus rudnickae]|uniref:HNH endonuclease n=1 Tax=Halorhabdus rudnickae TaxID=1775544 RepID=UPI001084762D|nr:HNH endonuclease signature motif containing protein [Halorhabdus rudnickae]